MCVCVRETKVPEVAYCCSKLALVVMQSLAVD